MQNNQLHSNLRKRLLSLGTIVAAMIGFAAEAQAEDRYIVDTPNGRMACLWSNGTYSDCRSLDTVVQQQTNTNTAIEDDDDVEVVIEDSYDDASNDASANNTQSVASETQTDKIDTITDYIVDRASSSTDSVVVDNVATPDENSYANVNDNDTASDDQSSYAQAAEVNTVDNSDDYDMWSEESWNAPPVAGPDVADSNSTTTSQRDDVASGVRPASYTSKQALYNDVKSYNADVFDDSFITEFGLGWGALISGSDIHNGFALNFNLGYKWETFSIDVENDFLLGIPDSDGFFGDDPNDEFLSYTLSAILGLNFFPSSNFQIKLGVGPALNYVTSYDYDVGVGNDCTLNEGSHLAAKALLNLHYVADYGFLVGMNAYWIPSFNSDGFEDHVVGVSIVIGYL